MEGNSKTRVNELFPTHNVLLTKADLNKKNPHSGIILEKCRRAGE